MTGYDEAYTWGRPTPYGEDTYTPSADDDDEVIEAYIEQQRMEFQRAWDGYVDAFNFDNQHNKITRKEVRRTGKTINVSKVHL